MTDSVEHLRELLDERTQRLEEADAALAKLLDERYETQTKALDAAFVAAKEAVAAALASAKEAVVKAEASHDRRFEAANGVKEELIQQANTFVSRAVFEAKVDALTQQIADLKEARDQAAGSGRTLTTVKATLITGGGLLVAIVGAVIAILALNA